MGGREKGDKEVEIGGRMGIRKRRTREKGDMGDKRERREEQEANGANEGVGKQ